MKIFLASQSPRRKDLLHKQGFDFKIVKSRYLEGPLAIKDPIAIARTHAICKNLFAATRQKSGIVLGADTLVQFNNEAIGKPKSKQDAFRILKKLSNKTHQVITAVSLRNLRTGSMCTFLTRSSVTFHKLASSTIQDYLKTGEYKDKAGAYGYQGYGNALVKSVRGLKTNVIGLPVEKIKPYIRKLNR